MNRLPLNVVTFAGENTDVYEGFRDYYFHYMAEVGGKKYGPYDTSVSLTEKDAKMTKALMSEVERVSGMKRPENVSIEAWATNPTVKWAIPTVANIMIDSIIPETIIKNIGLYTDIVTVGYGEAAQFDLAPNSLMTTSQAGNAQRTTFKQKEFKTSKSLVAVNHNITVAVSLYRVLAGQESMAEYVRKAVISIERDMTGEAYDVFSALVNGASFPAPLKKTGYTAENAMELLQKVTAYNNGAKAVLVGTPLALMNVLPDQAKGYRMVTQSENPGIQLIRNFYDYDILELSQVATGKFDYSLKLDDKKLYVMSPSSDKIIKGVLEGSSTSNTQDFYDTANLQSTTTFNKRYAFEGITNSVMGVITLA
jgi:hypothetical protein